MDKYPHLTPPVRMFMRMFEESLGNTKHIFLCGSRRFGYHLDSSDTDITVYLSDSTRYPAMMHDKLKKVLWFLNHDIKYMDIGDYDQRLFGIHVFHIEVLDIHIRVHHNLNDFLTEKKEHDIIEKKITPYEIYDWQNRKLQSIITHRYIPSGTSFYLELRRRYLDSTSCTDTIRNWFTSLFNKHQEKVS